jgi:hypothetical protein
MCLRFVFLLITRVTTWLRLSHREKAARGSSGRMRAMPGVGSTSLANGVSTAAQVGGPCGRGWIGPRRDVLSPYRPEAEAVVRVLTDELTAAGVRVLDMRARSRVGVVVTAEVVVWCYGRLLHWRWEDKELTWPAADAFCAARRPADAGLGDQLRM